MNYFFHIIFNAHQGIRQVVSECARGAGKASRISSCRSTRSKPLRAGLHAVAAVMAPGLCSSRPVRSNTTLHSSRAFAAGILATSSAVNMPCSDSLAESTVDFGLLQSSM
ncbi:ESPR domain-containing protein [Comamonas sp.]|uniref:ESPR domain-containing protein n=1 Tax=Comamonas sp. TaxID=34028 RepID=UPI00338DE963